MACVYVYVCVEVGIGSHGLKVKRILLTLIAVEYHLLDSMTNKSKSYCQFKKIKNPA